MLQELRGKYVNIVLSVQEGKGMDFLKAPVYIVANFNGRIMESDPCESKNNPVFNTELVWESEKKDLRKVRSLNAPLRVECYTMDSSLKKDSIGFVLLSLRSAPVVPSKIPEVEIQFKWYKLLGVPGEFKSNHPELLLSLTIRDHLTMKELPPAIPYIPEFVYESESLVEKEIIPIRFLQDGFIQIGDENVAKNTFYLTILVKTACNLHLLLPESMVFKSYTGKYYMSFVIFGLSLKSRPFYKDIHEDIVLDEKVCIRLLSNYDILKTFFEQYYDAVVSFNKGNEKLGVTKIKMKNLVLAEEFTERISYEENCYFDNTLEENSSNESMGSEEKPKPYVQIECILDKEMQCKHEEVGSGEFENSTENSINLAPPCDGYGDQIVDCEREKLFTSVKKSDKSKSLQTFMPKIEEIEEFTSKSTPILKLVSPRYEKAIQKPLPEYLENYRQFSLFIIIESIFWLKRMPIEYMKVKFKHPKSNSTLEIATEVESTPKKKLILDNVHCKLFFLAEMHRIGEVIQFKLPKVYFEDENEVQFTEPLRLDAKGFLADSCKEISFTTKVTSWSGREEIGEVSISMFLHEVGFHQIVSNQNGTELLPIILDESIVADTIEDLEKWKENQKERFNEQLKILEREHIKKISNNWKKRKDELEEKLIKSVERCKKLSDQLQKTKSTLDINKNLEEKRKVSEPEEFDEEVYRNVLKYKHCSGEELFKKITEVKKDNDHLKEMLCEKDKEIEFYRKSALTNEQTVNLLQEVKALQEKYEEVLKTKVYFKEQWKKAVQEVHELKMEKNKNLQDMILSEKEKLSQLSLDKFLNSNNFVAVPDDWEISGYNDFDFDVVRSVDVDDEDDDDDDGF